MNFNHKLFFIFLLVLCTIPKSSAFRSKLLRENNKKLPTQQKIIQAKSLRKEQKLQFSSQDIPLVPTLIATTAVVFAIFNIDNPVDLTDQGRAKARAKARAEKLARGDLPAKSNEELDPYRWRLFDDDNDDLELLDGGKRGGGGCG